MKNSYLMMKFGRMSKKFVKMVFFYWKGYNETKECVMITMNVIKY